ncbi:cytochrome P450 oxidoreductase OrdA-like protein [Xylaria intraflava]|nr:cytochrome P450 oxidoreductase OrdA-like protein [Xylaria intraflava]
MGVLADNPFLVSALLVGLGVIFRLLITKKKKTGPLPPGPKGLPLVGNIYHLPPKGVPEWKHWLQLKDAYGPISSITVFGTTYVFVQSRELATELLDKRSLIYSSRSKFVFGGEMIGWNKTILLTGYGEDFRLQRKSMHAMIGTPAAVLPYLPLLEKQTHRLLFRILQDPERLSVHVRLGTLASVLKMLYGYTVDPYKEDPLVNLGRETLQNFSKAFPTGAWLVDVIPALRYLPEWMPGAGFKKIAREWRSGFMANAGRSFQFTKRRMAKGNAGKSYVADFGLDLTPKEDEMVKWTATSLYAGGTDTIVNTLMAFFLAMMLHPEVQRKAQEEIDQVIGSGRLPGFNDRDSLPYIEAVVKEALRWFNVAPLSFPHATSDDDMVNGYYIPKGAIIFPNIWWFNHDPAVYPNPMAFDPSRFLGADPCPDPGDHTFGYGRRLCPGKHFAYPAVWLTIARSLAVFNIGKGLDENGVEIEGPAADPVSLFSHGTSIRPEPFKATIKPRSSQHADLIRKVETLYPPEKGDADEVEDIAP